MFEKLDNFRDFGGYPTGDGRRTRTGRLFRSAHHADVTDADLQRLTDLGIAVYVDLRRTRERERQPCRRPADFRGLLIENDIAATEDDSWLNFVRDTPDIDEDKFRGHMREFYRDGAFEERHIDLYARYFDALAERDGGVLIHCAAGKDRTGILAALTHHLAGVSAEDAMRDYLLTNESGALEKRLQPISDYIFTHTGKRLSHDAVRAAMRVEAEYLAVTFTEMSRRCGSVDGYLREVLGVDDAKRAAVLARLF